MESSGKGIRARYSKWTDWSHEGESS
jgi:hypothetical protein